MGSVLKSDSKKDTWDGRWWQTIFGKYDLPHEKDLDIGW